VGWSRRPVIAHDAEAPLLITLRYRELEIQVPHHHAAHVVQRTRFGDRLDQEVGLILSRQVLAVLISRRWRRRRAIAELSEPDLLAGFAVAHHQVAILPNARERAEARICVPRVRQTALRRLRRAVRRIGEAAWMSRNRVVV